MMIIKLDTSPAGFRFHSFVVLFILLSTLLIIEWVTKKNPNRLWPTDEELFFHIYFCFYWHDNSSTSTRVLHIIFIHKNIHVTPGYININLSCFLRSFNICLYNDFFKFPQKFVKKLLANKLNDFLWFKQLKTSI